MSVRFFIKFYITLRNERSYEKEVFAVMFCFVAVVNSSGLVTAVAVGNVTVTGRYVYNGTAYTDFVWEDNL